MTKWRTYVAAVLVALAFASPASAQTGNWYSHYAQVLGDRAQAGAALSEQIERARWYSHYAQVLGDRAQAGAALSEQIERARARSHMEAALTARGQSLNDLMAVGEPSATTPGNGFDWGAAGSVAGAAFALVLAALGIVFIVRGSRKLTETV